MAMLELPALEVSREYPRPTLPIPAFALRVELPMPMLRSPPLPGPPIASLPIAMLAVPTLLFSARSPRPMLCTLPLPAARRNMNCPL